MALSGCWWRNHLLPLLILMACWLPHLIGSQKLCHFEMDEEIPFGASIDNLYKCLRFTESATGDILTLKKPDPFTQNWNDLKDIVKIYDGTLKVNKRVDREDQQLSCFKQQICIKRFSVQLENPNFPERVDDVVFELAIRDVNDNVPQFSIDNRVLKVKENQLEQICPLPVVTDKDAGVNGETITQIVASEVPGRQDSLIDANTDRPQLRVSPALDYEVLQGFNLTLEACDKGKVKISCTRVQVRLEVVDENDNAPKFSQKQYKLGPVNEDTFQNERVSIGKVEASDLDYGDNGRIGYSIVDGPDSDGFAINATTGEIFLTKKLNAAFKSEIRFQVNARDNGLGTRKEDNADVLVSILDVNDNSPQIVHKFGHRVLVEGRENPKFAYLSIRDVDLGDNGKVACNVSPELAGQFQLQPVLSNQNSSVSTVGSPSLFTISSNFIYDREQQASVLISVLCWDHGQPARTSTFSLTVSIEDVNEFKPVFNATVYYDFQIAENKSAGEFVAKVTAWDADATANVTYAISDEANAMDCFSIDPASGVIRTRRPLDREAPEFQGAQTVYVITVQATDGKFTATARVNIRVTDVNDNRPGLIEPMTLAMNESFGTQSFNKQAVGRLFYTDADQPNSENSRVAFRLLSTQRSFDGHFSIDRNGSITASGVLDRESSPRHILLVELRDYGHPPLSSTGTVTIQLLDINDNAPKIRSPRPFQQLNLTEDSPPGVSFAEVNVTDADAECERMPSQDCLRAGGLRLELRQTAALFRVNSSTGQLLIANPLTLGQHVLNLTVTDRGWPKPLTSWITFSISVVPRSDQGHLFVSIWGAVTNSTVLLIIVVASSFITIILVIAIVMLNRRQPCCGLGGSAGADSGSSGGAGGGCGSSDCGEGLGGSMDKDLRNCQQHPPLPPPAPMSPFGGPHGGTLRRNIENGGGYNSIAYQPVANQFVQIGRHHDNLNNLYQIGLGDYEVASADSGHGASEEEIHSDMRAAVDQHARFLTLQAGAIRARSPIVACSCSSIMEEEPLIQQQQYQHQQQCHEHIPLTRGIAATSSGGMMLPGSGCSTFGRHQPTNQPQPQPLTLLSEPQFSSVCLGDRSTLGRGPRQASASGLPPIVGSRSGTPQQQQLHVLHPSQSSLDKSKSAAV